MRAPAIDFAPTAAARKAAGALVLALGIAAAAASAWQYAAASGELERIEADIRAATDAAERRRTAAARSAVPQIPGERVNAINNAIARLNVPWSELFAVFEGQRPKEVALLALLPDARKRVLVVQAETETAHAMIDFVDRLRAMPSFSEAVLVKHERRDQDAGQPYRFAVQVHWREAR